eukprot:2662005-Pyramimonas_sp.AAC.1
MMRQCFSSGERLLLSGWVTKHSKEDGRSFEPHVLIIPKSPNGEGSHNGRGGGEGRRETQSPQHKEGLRG